MRLFLPDPTFEQQLNHRAHDPSRSRSSASGHVRSWGHPDRSCTAPLPGWCQGVGSHPAPPSRCHPCLPSLHQVSCGNMWTAGDAPAQEPCSLGFRAPEDSDPHQGPVGREGWSLPPTASPSSARLASMACSPAVGSDFFHSASLAGFLSHWHNRWGLHGHRVPVGGAEDSKAAAAGSRASLCRPGVLVP